MKLGRREAILKHASLVRTTAWTVMIPLAYWQGWLKSVTFVALCSLYANVASDFASWRADDNPKMDLILEKLDAIEQHLRRDNGPADS